jgi:hypothetical protein
MFNHFDYFVDIGILYRFPWDKAEDKDPHYAYTQYIGRLREDSLDKYLDPETKEFLYVLMADQPHQGPCAAQIEKRPRSTKFILWKKKNFTVIFKFD